MEIIFKDIPNFEGEYQATNDGRIWSLKSKKFLSQQLKGPKGKQYYYVCLCKDGYKSCHRVNRLMALTFIKNPNRLPCVNHKDCNKLNNNAENLEWCTYEENNKYNDRIEKSVQTRKENGYCVKTIMCDKQTHEPIKIFDSINDAIKYLGLNKNSSSNIVATMKGRKKSAYGYFWRPE